SSRRSRARSAASLSAWEDTDTYSPAAIDSAPPTSPANPAVSTAPSASCAAETPMTRLEVEISPSFDPSTAARSQPARPLRWVSRWPGPARRGLTSHLAQPLRCVAASTDDQLAIAAGTIVDIYGPGTSRQEPSGLIQVYVGRHPRWPGRRVWHILASHPAGSHGRGHPSQEVELVKDSRIFASLGAVLLTALAAGPLAAATPASGHAPGDSPWSLFETFCYECHNTEDWAGGVAFDVIAEDEIGENADIFEKVVRKVRSQQMPPGGHEMPDPATRNRFVNWLEPRLDA